MQALQGNQALQVIDSIWQKRLAIFHQTVDEYLGWLRSNHPPRWKTAEVLLVNLKDFTQRQFVRFDDFQIYLNTYKAQVPTPDPIIPFMMPDTACNLILDQAFTDFSVIQLAIGQRMDGTTKVHLEIADKLAWLALAPVRANLDFNNTTVLTYLHKSPNIRLTPYAPVAVIGIPYTGNLRFGADERLDTNAAVTPDYLSIPHEIGHHVFWHSVVTINDANGQTSTIKLVEFLKTALQNDHDFVVRWVEEIFADIYSLAIGGPLIALSGQSAQQVVAADKFYIDDGEHPPAVLRPRIATKILKAFEYTDAVCDDLNTKWTEYCDGRKKGLWAIEKRAQNDWVKLYEDPQWVPIDLVMGSTKNLNRQKPLDCVLDTLLGIVKSTVTLVDPPPWWKGYLDIQGYLDNDGKPKLYDRFNAYLQQQTVLTLPSADQIESVDTTNGCPDMGAISPDIVQKDDHKYTEPCLRNMLKVSGWATKGSDKDPIRKIGSQQDPNTG